MLHTCEEIHSDQDPLGHAPATTEPAPNAPLRGTRASHRSRGTTASIHGRSSITSVTRISSTRTRYTELAADRVKDFWRSHISSPEMFPEAEISGGRSAPIEKNVDWRPPSGQEFMSAGCRRLWATERLNVESVYWYSAVAATTSWADGTQMPHLRPQPGRPAAPG
jgi:hypothetical protein